MKQIRRGVFETNSSSTHSLTIITKQDFDAYKNGKLIFDRYNSKLIDVKDKEADEDDERYWVFDAFGGEYFETDNTSFTTPSGDQVVAMCYYGYDG